MTGDQPSLRERRRAAGLTQVALGELAGVSESAVRAAEGGWASKETVAKIDAALAKRGR